MDIKKEIINKINNFIIENNISSSQTSNVPVCFQEFALSGGFDESMLNFFISALIDDEETLKIFLGEKLFSCAEFQNYFSALKNNTTGN